MPRSQILSRLPFAPFAFSRAKGFWGITLAGCFACPPSSKPTFQQRYGPVSFQNCATCHRPGESSPFSRAHLSRVQKRANKLPA